MGKALKVDYKNLKAEYKNGELKGTIEILNEEGTETVINEVNVTADVKELLASLQDEETISVNIKKYKEPAVKEKQPIFKYHCKCDYLNVHCNDCDEDFQLEEK